MMTYIISGGQLDLEFAKDLLLSEEEKVIIAADSGLDACEKMQITPDYVIGDFDSLSEEGQSLLAKQMGEVIRLNPIKDDTDTEAALHLAFEKTEGPITILGGTGSRLDHVLGNLSILLQGIDKEREIFLWDVCNRIRVVANHCFLKKEEQFGSFVSVFPVQGMARGVDLKGFYYPLEKATLTGDNSLGVSNEIVDEVAEISVEEGKLLVVESRD